MSGDYADLRALAEAATSGPWRAVTSVEDAEWDSAYNANVKGPRGEWVAECLPEGEGRRDAAYIAAVNPARILALLADLDAARGDAERLREASIFSTFAEVVADIEGQRDALAAKVEAVTAEVERGRRVAWRIAVSLGEVERTEPLAADADIEDLWARYSTRIGIERSSRALDGTP